MLIPETLVINYSDNSIFGEKHRHDVDVKYLPSQTSEIWDVRPRFCFSHPFILINGII